MESDPIDSAHNAAQSLFLFSQMLMTGPGLAKRLKIVFEQTAQSPQLPDHHLVCVGDKRSAAKKAPPYVFGHGQPGNAGLFRKAHFFFHRHAKCDQQICGVLAAGLCAFHAFCLWSVRSPRRMLLPLGVQREALWQDGVVVLQLPSCHEEPASGSGRIVATAI